MKYQKIDLPPRVALFVDALSYVKGFMQAQVGNFSYDLSTASGTQTITGIGFTPKAVIFLGAVDTSAQATWGFDDGTNHFTVTNYAPVAGQFRDSPAGAMWLLKDNSNYQVAAVSAFNSNGFTLTWTKTGAPTGVASIGFIALGG